jgi:uncharacterized protein (TIGR02246 family)
MKRFFVAALLLLAFSAVAPAQDTDKEEQAVRDVLRRWIDALAKNDLATISSIIADDYIITTSDGKVLDKEQDLAPLKSGDVKFDSAAVEEVKVRIYGDSAVVTGIEIFKVSVKGRSFDVRERFTDVYVKRNGTWRPVAAHSGPVGK